MLLNLDAKPPQKSISYKANSLALWVQALVQWKLSWVHLRFNVNQRNFSSETSLFFDGMVIYNFELDSCTWM